MKIIEISSPLDCPKRTPHTMICWHRDRQGEFMKCNEVEVDTFPARCPLEDAK